jgi:hypothetical protein
MNPPKSLIAPFIVVQDWMIKGLKDAIAYRFIPG